MIERTCTAQTPGGVFCGKPGLPGAPFPVCVRHAAQLYEFLHKRVSDAEVRSFDHVLEGMSVERRPSGRYHDERRAQAHEVVYYVQVGDLLKIGRTVNLRDRLRKYPPNRRLLATEHGDAGLEARRLAEFRDHLAYGAEWFTLAPPLVAHITRLRSRPRFRVSPSTP